MYYQILYLLARCFVEAENILIAVLLVVPSMLSLHMSCRAVYCISHFLKRFLWGGGFSDLAKSTSSSKGK